MDYIKKISKETIETKLGRIIRPNIVSMGVDVAQTNTGIAILKTTDTYIIIESTYMVKLPSLSKKDHKKTEILLNRVDLFLEQLDDLKHLIIQKHHLDELIIENCFLQFSPLTFQTLARFGILVYERFRHISKHSDFLSANQWRKIIGFKAQKKKALKAEVVDYIKKLFDLETELKEDEYEAIGLGLAGLIQ